MPNRRNDYSLPNKTAARRLPLAERGENDKVDYSVGHDNLLD
ncbi:hypothetical protein [Fibrobacter succinogenes]|nr:hypothetical protein [Fibrobacter succinogenes]